MPTESNSDLALARRTQGRRALRLGIGVTLTFLVALAFDWTLAYLAPVFAAPMLQKLAAPSLKSAIEMLLVTVVIMLLCMLAGGISQAYPVFFLRPCFRFCTGHSVMVCAMVRPWSCCCSCSG